MTYSTLSEIIANEADAFRHFTWSVLLTREFDNDTARLITTEDLFQFALSEKVIIRRLEEATQEKRDIVLEDINSNL